MLCWHCNSDKIALRVDGWLCKACGQHGLLAAETLPSNWRDASLVNTPYKAVKKET